MERNFFIPAPHDGCYTRLFASPVHGIGVQAIKDIQRGTYMFPHDVCEMSYFYEKDLNLDSMEPEVKRLYEDFCVFKQGKVAAPASFNALTVQWYLNSGTTPNVACDASLDFYALCDIKAGEELIVDYSTYSDR